MGKRAGRKGSDRIERHVMVGQLLDRYGPLLTDRQREFVRLHYCEDMSFGEIGKLNEVSRQAVHDAVRHAIAAMENYEEKLGLHAAELDAGEAASGVETTLPLLHDLLETVRKQGVIYDTRGLRDRIAQIIDALSDGGGK